jgi:aminomethyltransferase
MLGTTFSRIVNFKPNFIQYASISISSRLNGSKPSRTCLYDFHVRHGGKMVDFAGFEMPVQYADQTIQQSHMFTRDKCSLFDVSHMMQTKVYGKDRFKYIESLIVGDIQGLRPDSGTLTVFTNSQGGIIDDLIVNSTSLDYLYVVSNAGCAEKDLKHLREAERQKKADGLDISLNLIEDCGLLALQGPRMHDVLQPGVPFDLKTLPFMNTRETRVFTFDNCRITRCGYTGEDGVEISVPKKYAEALAEKLLEAQDKEKQPLCKLAGLGARDTLRLEAGLCLYGNDIDENTTPIEAGLAWTIGKRRRELRDFPGANVILSQLKEKPSKKRVGLRLLANNGPSARQHMLIFDQNNVEIGEVTSGCPSPSLKQNIAMGYLNAKYCNIGTKVSIKIRNKTSEAEVVKLPFVPTRYYQISK